MSVSRESFRHFIDGQLGSLYIEPSMHLSDRKLSPKTPHIAGNPTHQVWLVYRDFTFRTIVEAKDEAEAVWLADHNFLCSYPLSRTRVTFGERKAVMLVEIPHSMGN